MFRRSITLGATVAAALAAAIAAACTDRSPVNPAPLGDAAVVAGPAPGQKPERLARWFARALRNPVFRAYLKAQLDASPFAEHKLQFQTFLGSNGGRARRYVAAENGETEAGITQASRAAIALEAYFPVPAHRAAWTGDENVLVATAVTDREVPVAFDPQGRRRLLDPDTPPDTPVIALVPVETDFTLEPQRLMVCPDCGDDGGGGGGGGGINPDVQPSAPPAGLYMTKTHFVQDFEGWLKGAPEFEVHILGQKAQTDSLLSYQCAGERSGAPYYFNQDNLDWSGSVLLFSKTQIDQYNAAHPGQNVRVFVVEDDDTACEIKTGKDRWSPLMTAVDAANQAQTAGKDTTSSTATKIWKYAKALYNLYLAVASWIMTNDELVGNAVQDVIVGEYHTGFNWIVKGDNNVTNGWINLEMK
jgi:hypothetical protein